VDIVLNILVCFGLLSVGLAFVILLPLVGNVLVAVFTTVFAEKAYAQFRGEVSGTVMSAPKEAPAVQSDVEEPHGPAALKTYVGVYCALLVLTVVTVGVSELGLIMREAVFWAVVVASMKASLVIAWFMHVKGGAAINRLILSTSLFFMMVFFTLTMADLSTRDWVFEDEGQWATIKEAQNKGELPAGWSAAESAAETK